jgi:hypothetical protein
VERNTYATSIFIASPLATVRDYVSRGDSLSEYTRFSRMREQVDDTTWLGTASGYQNGLYYHVRNRTAGALSIVEWHCGAELGRYYHVYPMFLFEPAYFGSREDGTYYHWVSFVDPARATPMIKQGLPTVHRSEARSLKAQIERRAGHRAPVQGELDVRSHTIYIDAPLADAAEVLADPARATEWGYLMRRDGARLYDEYDREIEIRIVQHDLGEYRILEHETRYVGSEHRVRTPIVSIPAAYAFAQPAAPGFIMHRISAWPAQRTAGKQSPDDYDTEAINAKRILEARAGNLTTYARGCSYEP